MKTTEHETRATGNGFHVQRNIWDDISGCAVPRHWMGGWLHYRKLATIGYIPTSDIREQIKDKYPFDYVFDFQLLAQKTGDQRATIMNNWVLFGMTASGDLDTGGIAGSSFQAQIYIGKQRKGVALSDRPIGGENQFGTARFVRWLRTPLWIPPETPILIRVQNQDLTGETNNIQIVLQGVGD